MQLSQTHVGLASQELEICTVAPTAVGFRGLDSQKAVGNPGLKMWSFQKADNSNKTKSDHKLTCPQPVSQQSQGSTCAARVLQCARYFYGKYT